ncbi:MAG: hypothetical protein JST40_05050 [Armatimonadetes bacterium]|nr:hypothetical protein [Armatimonadota bacterium]
MQAQGKEAKKDLPVPLIVAVVIVAIGLVVFLLMRAGAGEPEFKPAAVTGKTPEYIKAKMSPEQRAQVEKYEKEHGLSDKPEGMQQQQPQANPTQGL